MNRLENIFACFGAVLLLTVAQGRTETAFWSDTFGANAGTRWTTNSIWQIGMPTFGPAGTHTGSNCAATGLKSGAPANVDARLICTNYNGTNWLLVPAASQFPRLRYWQWYDYVNGEGFVEILQAGSTNWQTIAATNLGFAGTANYSSGVWSRPAIDLRGFAGTKVQIAFHFISGANYGSNPGWYVDTVAVVTNNPGFNNPEGFEAGLGDWSVDAGTWEVGEPTSGPATNTAGFRAHSGTNCAATVLAGNYGYNMDTRLISPPLVVPASGSQRLHFWQWYSFVNAQAFVEINTNTSIGMTNSTITTTVFSSLNTNIYQLFGATNVGYTSPFYWNQTTRGWTNATKELGNIDDLDGYHFEAGNAPLSSIGISNYIFNYNCNYRATILPDPLSVAATNYLNWQGLKWTNTAGNDIPVGYFDTNYTYTYTTNTTVIFWQTISQTNKSFGSTSVTSGGWTNAAIDLSAYAGQTVQVAFHFQSGPSGYYGTAPGWYVDDISVGDALVVTVPANQTINAGQTLTANIFATNALEPGSTFSLGLVPPATNVWLTTNGVLTLTNSAALIGTNVIYVQATDNQSPPLSATNAFTVIVLPPAAPTLAVSNFSSSRRSFKFSFQTFTNLTWRIETATNLNSPAWLPVLTNTAGPGGILQFTDALATNYLQRFYRAVFP